MEKGKNPMVEEAEEQKGKMRSHFSHKISKDELETLSKGTTEYTWKQHAFDSQVLVGTGDRLVCDPYTLSPNLYNQWLHVHKQESEDEDFNSSKQLYFYKLCNSYRDVLHQGGDAKCFMDSYVVHVLNHIFRTTASAKACTDRGFSRPQVVILLPFRSTAVRLVRRLITLTPATIEVNKKDMDWFDNNFISGKEKECFMVCIGLERETLRLRLNEDFQSSDIIVVSPLSLFSKILLAEKPTKGNVDYLSSIELLVVDYADVHIMKSMGEWFFVPKILDHLNQTPGDVRIRSWYVDGQAQFYRQTIILSSFTDRDIKHLFEQNCHNFEGKLLLSDEVSHNKTLGFNPLGFNPLGQFIKTMLSTPPTSPKPSTEAACKLSLSYLPGTCILDIIEGKKTEIPVGVINCISLHGLYQTKALKFPCPVALKEFKVCDDWVALLGRCMPHLPSDKARKGMMVHEFARHAKHINFLDEKTYVPFVVWLFISYKFGEMLSNSWEAILEKSTGSVSILNFEWVGLRVGDLAAILHEHPPIRDSQGELIIKVVKYLEKFFLFEVHCNFTKEGELAARRKNMIIWTKNRKDKGKGKEDSGSYPVEEVSDTNKVLLSEIVYLMKPSQY